MKFKWSVWWVVLYKTSFLAWISWTRDTYISNTQFYATTNNGMQLGSQTQAKFYLCINIETGHWAHNMKKQCVIKNIWTKEAQWLLIKLNLKKNDFWLNNSLQFDGWHDHDVVSSHPSKHLWLLTTFVLGTHHQNTYKNYMTSHSLLFKSSPHSHN